jgi:hypothetical protein
VDFAQHRPDGRSRRFQAWRSAGEQIESISERRPDPRSAMTEQGRLPDLVAAAAEQGLASRGAFAPRPADGVPDVAPRRPAGTLVLLGLAGRAGFPAFAASPEVADGGDDPLDRWSRRVIAAVATRFLGLALFPFGGPPYHPFQRWAMRAEDVRPSPLGLLIHPVWGLWHSYRGAVALEETCILPEPERAAKGPCDACAGRPCLSACPAGAHSAAGFDDAACHAHLAGPASAACHAGGCLSRRACPVGREHAHEPLQAAFTMRAFHRAQRRRHAAPGRAGP